MTKAQIIDELHKHGEWWANETYTKKVLERYLNNLLRAKALSDEDLIAYVKRKAGERY